MAEPPDVFEKYLSDLVLLRAIAVKPLKLLRIGWTRGQRPPDFLKNRCVLMPLRVILATKLLSSNNTAVVGAEPPDFFKNRGVLVLLRTILGREGGKL